VRAYNNPSHRAWEGRAIAQSGYATAMIDTSDGFLGDLGHICQESGVGAELIQKDFPISENLRQAAPQLERDPHEFALGDSDDYELIVTCSPDHVDRIRAIVAALSETPVSHVGRITDAAGEITMVFPDGTKHEITPTGWDHFTR
jgi:thiamine-monophosphate kinase